MVGHWGWGGGGVSAWVIGVSAVFVSSWQFIMLFHMQPPRRVHVLNTFAGRGRLVVRVPNPRVWDADLIKQLCPVAFPRPSDLIQLCLQIT